MSNALALAADDLDRLADPGEFVVLACTRAKEWLTEAIERGDIDQIVELKSQAEAIRVYTAQKQLGKDAELAAAEIVRRAERGIGLSIRRGQEAGEIRARGMDARTDLHVDSTLISPTEFVSASELSGNAAGIYLLTDDVSDQQFDAAIEEARAEENLSRANVVRKVRGRPRLQPRPTLARHEIHRKGRRINPDRIINETISMLEGIALGLALIEDIKSLDAEKRPVWLEGLREPLAAINRFHKELQRG